MNPQIEALSEIIGSCNTRCDHPFDCSHCKAFRVYNAGYRKSTDVARQIFAEIDGITDLFAGGAISELEMYDMLGKLKKKCEREEIQ